MQNNFKLIFVLVIIFLGSVILFSKRSFIVENKNLLSGFFKEETQPVVPKQKVPKPDIDGSKIKGLYVNASTLYSQKLDRLINLAKTTEVNSLIIDIKDDNGNIHTGENIANLVELLHQNNIYVIARIVVFKDNIFAREHPEVALKTKKGKLWVDNLKSAWLDPASSLVRQHILEVSKKIIDLDFDELNYDYIRFATDRGSENVVYPVWDGKTSKQEVMSDFFELLNKELKQYNPEIKLSIDIFGYTFLRKDDLNIGQRLEDTIKFFDFICPMVYPSHYDSGNFNFKNPAEHPYEVISETLKAGKEIFDNNQIPITRIRPWLQVFDLGTKYDAAMIKKEKQAVYDFGLSGWLMWDPNNRYVESTLEKEL